MMQLSMFPNFLDSKMIGIDRGKMTTTTMINRVNTMTPRQNDLVVKNRQINYLVISLVKPLLSRIFCEKSVRENFCTLWENDFSKTVALTKVL